MLKSRLVKVMNAQLDSRGREVVAPAADICESADGYQLWCEMPGLESDEISIDLHPGRVRLQGAAHLEMPAGLKVQAMEFCAVLYRLDMPIPQDVDEKAISAAYENGVLRLELPRKKQSLGRRVSVGS